MTAHTYTADKNIMYILPSGNWFTGFVANHRTRTVSFNYCDRRRNGQVARTYTVSFMDDNSTVRNVIAISAQGGRIEHFKSTVARDVCANILRRAQMVAFESDFAEEVEQNEPAKVSLSEKFEQINAKSKQETIMNGVLMLIVTLLFIVFASTSLYLLAGGEATKETMDVLLTSGFAGIFLCILSMMKP